MTTGTETTMAAETDATDDKQILDYPDQILDHNYDGIEEYDNPMPGWWVWLFIGTVVWSGVYVGGIWLGYIDSYDEALAASQAEIKQLRLATEEAAPEVTQDTLAAAVDDPALLQAGEGAYKTNCASCHGQQGEGLIGPNLTDDYWLHGGALTEIYATVETGVTAKGMPAWEGILTPEELIGVTAYIRTLHGTEPAGAKEPEGEAVTIE